MENRKKEYKEKILKEEKEKLEKVILQNSGNQTPKNEEEENS